MFGGKEICMTEKATVTFRDDTSGKQVVLTAERSPDWTMTMNWDFGADGVKDADHGLYLDLVSEFFRKLEQNPTVED